MAKKPRQLHERTAKRQERLDSVIRRRFVASHMSDAKWVKLLQVAASCSDAAPRMNYKLVCEPEIHFSYTPPHAEAVEAEWFHEPVLYRGVEWIEFPSTYEVPRGAGLEPMVRMQDLASLRQRLESAGRFPLQETATGLRVIAYAEA